MTRRLAAAAVALALGALLAPPTVSGAASGVVADVGAPVAGATGIGDPYWPQDGNGGIDVASYRIRDSYDFDSRRLSGRTKLRLTATQDLASFHLDFLLPVSKVTVDGARAAHGRPSSHELRITPKAPLAAGTAHTVTVTYAGRPGERRYAGERNWLASPREVVTMNQPHMAPWWFPANDHPSDKARFHIRVTVPTGREVVANGQLVGKKRHGARTTWAWKAEEPMTTYLAFFAAGDFAIEKGASGGLPWLVAVSRALPPQERRASMSLMRRTPRVVDALEADLGPYPFSVVGGLTTSLPVGFALENQTRPTYPAVGRHYVSLVVHELAHQWFGDHVAVARWRDIWLNEGAATFMEWRWWETHGGPSAARTLQDSWASFPAGDPFWDVVIGDPGPGKIFHSAVYDRGAMTMQALRHRIGDQAFWLLLRTWLDQKGGGNATSEEFEALASQLSGQDLTSFFTAWLRTPERPAPTAANGLG
ncbi:peptidase [Nocardioides gansuensis]|uniref:Aminopeptidase N n=1 Tax=Nocardioides gansuensis TaxID=2138300 RepID=A0A2T8FAE5_9ACTN|nr:M1 family metallopeptidase [Nocardioides gansuensis]PVG82676.1 peptidase [Nocardioides gansuensis]